MKILCIGHASYDITFLVDKFIVENTKNRMDNRTECGGGPASNAAYLLGKYGLETYFMGIVGDDFYGNKIEKEFDEIGVSTKYLLKKDNYTTTVSTIIANKSNGSRTILTYKDASKSYPKTDIDFEPDIILTDGQEIEISNYLIDKYKNAISVIDAGRATEDIIELSKKVNYLVCSREFAEAVIGKKTNDDYVNLYKKMKEIFKNEIVITLENNGSLYEFESSIRIMPSLKVKAVDSTGAGDLFHGAFVYGLAKNYEFENILKISNIVGALSVTKVGGRFSVPTKEEVRSVYDGFE